MVATGVWLWTLLGWMLLPGAAGALPPSTPSTIDDWFLHAATSSGNEIDWSKDGGHSTPLQAGKEALLDGEGDDIHPHFVPHFPSQEEAALSNHSSTKHYDDEVDEDKVNTRSTTTGEERPPFQNRGKLMVELNSSPFLPNRFSRRHQVRPPITSSMIDQDACFIHPFPAHDGAPPTDKIIMSIDPSSSLRLISKALQLSASLLSVTTGTLRLLGPLIVARRVLLSITHLFTDYMTGRYLRTTYTKLERAYIRFYEAPAVLRATARTFSQIAVFTLLSTTLKWVMQNIHPSCSCCLVTSTTSVAHKYDRGVAFICALLWIATVCGLGFVFINAVSNWGGPLRVQADIVHPSSSFYSFSTTASISSTTPNHLNGYYDMRSSNVFIRPWHIIQWMQKHPTEWINGLLGYPSSATRYFIKRRRRRKLFIPNPLLFPMAWPPLRFIQFLIFAMILSTEPCNYTFKYITNKGGDGGAGGTTSVDPVGKLIRLFLVQLALSDEWSRVFLGEKRIGLGVVAVTCHFISMLNFITSAAMMNARLTILMIPSLIAVIVSGYLNFVIFWDRLDRTRKEAAINAFYGTTKGTLAGTTVTHPS